MKKYLVLALIFLLFFSFYFKIASASATECRVYVNGYCQVGYHFDPTEYEKYTQESTGTPTETLPEVTAPTDFKTKILTLIFQFFAMVVLLVLLIVLLSHVLESKKPKK